MKLRMNFGIVKTVIIAIVIVFALALAGVDIAMLAGAPGVSTSMPAIAAVSLVASLLIAVAGAVLLFNSYYKFEKEKLVVILGIFKDVVPYENVTAVRQNGETREVYLFAKGKKIQDGETVIRFNVDKGKTDGILEAIRQAMPDLIIEVFTPENSEPKH